MEEPSTGERVVEDAGRSDDPAGDGTDETAGQTRAALPAALERALATVPAPVFVVDDAGTVLSVNGAVEDRLGYAPDEVVGGDVTACCPDLSAAALAAHCGDAASGESVETRGVTADGEEVWLGLDVAERRVGDRSVSVAVAHDVTEYRARERQLEQYERIVETIDDGVYVLDDAFDITAVNDATEEITGYDRSELVGANASLLASEETLSQATAVSEALLSSDGDAATISTTIETAAGEQLPIETRFSVYPFGDGSYGQVGVVRDISDRIWYEQTLTTLHDATRELLGAETPRDVGDLVVEMVTDVIDLSAAVVYRFDSDVNRLRPVASAGAFPADPADLPPVAAGDGLLWETFLEGERTVVDGPGPDADSGVFGGRTAVPGETGVALPLADHGVFFLTMDEDDRLDPGTMQLIDLVAASAEAALERVDRDRRLREHERELRERNERLRRLERINEVIRRIDAAVVDAESRSEVETAVCEELARSPLFSLAWVGREDDGELAASAWAGDGDGYLDAIDRSLAGEGGPPAVRTARSGAVTYAPSVTDRLREEDWRVEAAARGFGSALSVPVAGDDVTYGVLTLYAEEGDAFPDRIESVVEELAASVANAVRAVETRQWLSVERVVELDLRVAATSSPLVRLARRTDCAFDHEGTVSLSSDAGRAFLRVADGDRDTVVDAATDLTAVRSVRELGSDDGDGDRLAVEFRPPSVATAATDLGSRVRSLVVDGDGVDCTVAVPATTDVRRFVEALGERFDRATLDARRERQPSRRTIGDFRSEVRETLTDRQWQVVRTAYLSGFFEWPRRTTGAEIAETFDLSQPTINRHLRLGERRLLELAFDDE